MAYLEQTENGPQWKFTLDEEKLRSEVINKWQYAYDQRTRAYKFLRDQSLEEFWSQSRDLFNGYVPPASSVEDEWKSRAFKKKTRHKVIATVASYVSSGLGLDFTAVDPDDRIDSDLSRVCEDTYNWSSETENFDYKLVRAFLDMATVGTVHIYEEVAWDKRKIKKIDDIDLSTGEVKWTEKDNVDFKGPRAEIIPNEEIFPGDNWEPDIQNQPCLFRRKLTNYENARKTFDKYANWKAVVKGSSYFLPPNGLDEKEEDDSGDDKIEILYYWDKPNDEYNVFINGIPMHPPNYPFPYKHKLYPFAKDINEPFADQRFYWGNSIPFTSKDEQEMINDLWRMMIDSTKLKIKPPLFTNNAELASTDLIVPGTIAPMELGDRVETIDHVSKGVSTADFDMLTLAERQVDENTIDPLLTGKQASGDPTATEVKIIAGSADRLRGFNEQFIGGLLLQHGILRIANALWFLKIDSDFKTIIRGDVKTIGNKTGRRKTVFMKEGDLPTSKDVFDAEAFFERSGKPTQIQVVNADALENFRYRVSIASVPKQKRSTANRLAVALQKYQVYANNPLIDQQVNTSKLVKAMGDNPDELVKQSQEMEPPQIQQQNPALVEAASRVESPLTFV
jgi:hypothetical protein